MRSWRWQPPVLSPIAPRSLVDGLSAAIGLHGADHEEAVAELKSCFGSAEVVLTDSGTSALVLALRSILPPGGIVAYPAYGCIDLTAAAIAAGVRVRLYDLDPETLSPDLPSLEKAVMRGVDGIVAVHLFGYAADIVGVQKIADRFGLPVFEDAAQAGRSTLGGVPAGAIADVGILSFGRGKGVTCGSGGAILMKNQPNEQWTRQVRESLGAPRRGGRDVATLGAQWFLGRPSLYRVPASIPILRLGEMVYHRAHMPRPMSASAAAVLRTALRMAGMEVENRRARAHRLMPYISAASNLRAIRPVPGSHCGFLRLAVLDKTGRAMPQPTLGVMRGYPLTLDQHAELQPVLLSGEKAGNGAKFLRDRLFTLPTHSRLDHHDILRLGYWLSDSGLARDSSLFI